MSALTDKVTAEHLTETWWDIDTPAHRADCPCGWVAEHQTRAEAVAAADAHLLEAVEEAAREKAATEIEAVRIVCPVHHIPDCSPLLNGCSLPIALHGRRLADAQIARGGA